MCYQVFLSTNTEDDLSVNDSELIKFSKDLPFHPPLNTLLYENLWHIQSEAVCSCSFRHLHVSSTELGFSEPVDWYPEENDHIEATAQFTSIIRELLARKVELDCVDLWQDEPLEFGSLPSIEIDLSIMSDTEFRFFENHHFTFTST